jgi:hypothetical protein
MSTKTHQTIALGSLVGALVSCAAPRTQIIVVVDTDLVVPTQMGSLRVTVLDPNGNESEVRSITLAGNAGAQCADSATRYCVPLSFLLVPKERRPESSPVELTVDGVEGSDALSGRVRVSVRARLAFMPGRTLRLPIFLSSSCQQVVCAAGLTCVEDGVCVPIERPIGVAEIDPRTGTPVDVAIADASEPLDVRSRRPNRDADTQDRPAIDAQSNDVSADVPSDACPAALISCGARCVNTQNNQQHCGRCDNQCAGSTRCSMGECR